MADIKDVTPKPEKRYQIEVSPEELAIIMQGLRILKRVGFESCNQSGTMQVRGLVSPSKGDAALMLANQLENGLLAV